jgi:pimeloyl-ACP methyl ester carboxylesterase
MPDLGRIDATRATLVWGGRDLIVSEWMRKRWSAALPDADEVTLPGFPHQPHLRDPQEIADLIRGRIGVD